MIDTHETALNLRFKLDNMRKIFDEDESEQLRVKQGFFSVNPNTSNFPDFEYDSKVPKAVKDSKKERRSFKSQDASMYPSENENFQK